jgi:hypothetical protein
MRMKSGETSTKNNSIYCSPNIIKVTKFRILKWAGHVARMEEGRGVLSKFQQVNLE